MEDANPRKESNAQARRQKDVVTWVRIPVPNKFFFHEISIKMYLCNHLRWEFGNNESINRLMLKSGRCSPKSNKDLLKS